MMPENQSEILRPLPDFYHNAAAHPTPDDALAGGDNVAERDFASHRRDLGPVEIGREAAPRLLPHRQRAHDGIDAQKRDRRVE